MQPRAAPAFDDSTAPLSFDDGSLPDLKFVDDSIPTFPPPPMHGSPPPRRRARASPDLFNDGTPQFVENPEEMLLLKELAPEDQGDPMLEGFESTMINPSVARARSDRTKTAPIVAEPQPAARNCPRCRREVPGTSAFCDTCGSRVPKLIRKKPEGDPKRCGTCGYRNKPTEEACGNCGSFLR